MTKIIDKKIHFHTPWFDLEGKTILGIGGKPEEYYSISAKDYVCLVALTPENKIVFVRQFRPAVEEFTLELPSGYVEDGEDPKLAGLRELLEETGYKCRKISVVGCLNPDTGRLSNKQWCYFGEVVPSDSFEGEPGITTVLLSMKELKDYILTSKFDHSLHIAAVLLCALSNKISLQDEQ